MSEYCDRFQFDPEKSALQNFFNLIYRNNKVRLTSREVEVELPRPVDDPDGDNSIILVKGKAGGPITDQVEMYYARADIDQYYPVFEIDLKDLLNVNDKEALTAYIDGQFNLVDGEFDLDIDDPFGSLALYTSIDLVAKPDSLIYIGKKSINIFWSGGPFRITDEGIWRVTDEGHLRYVD
jgi:hypothetical protein